jgi:hypothetical protein
LEHYLGVQTLVIPMDSREHLHQRHHQVVLASVVNATSRELRYETCRLDLLTFATPQSTELCHLDVLTLLGLLEKVSINETQVAVLTNLDRPYALGKVACKNLNFLHIFPGIFSYFLQ